MANDVIDLSAFKNAKPNAAFAALRAQRESLADGIGSSYPVVGYKGKNWSLRHRGERYAFTRPDDGTPANHIDVIILRGAPNKSKSYYSKEDGPYDDATSSGKRPICASLNGVVPDADVAQKQSDVCALCPRNEWKTNNKGKKERDCTDYKRLAVLFRPAEIQRTIGQELTEPAFLRIPPASLSDLAKYGEIMEGQGFFYSELITRISFDNTAYPKFIFKPIAQVSVEEAPWVISMRDDPITLRITGEEITAQLGARTVTAAPAAPKIAAPVGPTPAEIAAKAKAEKAAALKAQLAALEAEGDEEVETVEITPPPKKAASKKEAKPAPVIDNDTDESENSTAEIDARIAGLLGD